jgi:D-aminoacyl-tRNA deacylase
MRAVIQRVKNASVSVNQQKVGEIQQGLLVLLGIEPNDNDEDIEWLCGKIVRLRLFDDEAGIMNLSVNDINGGILIVSQFTLFASTKKGNRPSYIAAAKPDIAIPIYEKFIKQLTAISGVKIETGLFGEMMNVTLINDGPVTIIMDTKNKE